MMTGCAVALLVTFASHMFAPHAAGLAAGANQLAPRAYDPVPLGATMPDGWLLSQLNAQDAGLCGNKYLGGGAHASDSKWVGGKGYNGLDESYVYWLNGFLPLAVQLGDTKKMAEIHEQMDYIFAAAENNTVAAGRGPTP